jgi:hypothetical protein
MGLLETAADLHRRGVIRRFSAVLRHREAGFRARVQTADRGGLMAEVKNDPFSMPDPRHVASQLLGAIDWQTEVSGFCRCPGEAFHTSANGKRDCRVNVDGAPTIFCFHSSCSPAVAEANKRLRRGLGTPWTLMLPGGKILRAGDVKLMVLKLAARPKDFVPNQRPDLRTPPPTSPATPKVLPASAPAPK